MPDGGSPSLVNLALTNWSANQLVLLNRDVIANGRPAPERQMNNTKEIRKNTRRLVGLVTSSFNGQQPFCLWKEKKEGLA